MLCVLISYYTGLQCKLLCIKEVLILDFGEYPSITELITTQLCQKELLFSR